MRDTALRLEGELRTAILLLACALGGCHSPPTFSEQAHVVESKYFRITTDVRCDQVMALNTQVLTWALEDMCHRWAFKRPEGRKLDAYLFAREGDFHRFAHVHDNYSPDLAGFYCSGCDAMAVVATPRSPESLVELLRLTETQALRLANTVHELNHQLMHQRLGTLHYRSLPHWLAEGLADQEKFRAWERLDGGFDSQGISAIRKTLSMLAFALRSLYGHRIFTDPEDEGLEETTWHPDHYALHFALCHTLRDISPGALREFALRGIPPGEGDVNRLERTIKAHALVLASENLLRLSASPWDQGRFDEEGTAGALALLWNRPGLRGATRVSLEKFVTLQRQRLKTGRPLEVVVSLQERRGWLRSRKDALISARRSVLRLLDGVRLTPSAEARFFETIAVRLNSPRGAQRESTLSSRQ